MASFQKFVHRYPLKGFIAVITRLDVQDGEPWAAAGNLCYTAIYRDTGLQHRRARHLRLPVCRQSGDVRCNKTGDKIISNRISDSYFYFPLSVFVQNITVT